MILTDEELKKTPSRELLFDYQLPALKGADLETVIEIGDEMEGRQNSRGLTRTSLGWFSPEKIERGLRTRAIKSDKDGKLCVGILTRKTYNDKGKVTGIETSYERFQEWLESRDEGVVSGKEVQITDEERDKLEDFVDFTV